MKHYTEIVPFELAKKIAAAGYKQKDYGSIYTEDGTHIGCAMPSPVRGITYNAPTYAEVFDWLLEKGISIEVRRYRSFDDTIYWSASAMSLQEHYATGLRKGWHTAANRAISEALEILEEKK